jgi:hypothetical protein
VCICCCSVVVIVVRLELGVDGGPVFVGGSLEEDFVDGEGCLSLRSGIRNGLGDITQTPFYSLARQYPTLARAVSPPTPDELAWSLGEQIPNAERCP